MSLEDSDKFLGLERKRKLCLKLDNLARQQKNVRF